MRLFFEGNTSMPEEPVMVSAAVFRTPDGNEVMVGRDSTERTVYPDGSFQMEWDGCCILKGGKRQYLTEEDISAFGDMEFLELKPEDDAPDGYAVTVSSVWTLDVISP